MAYVLRVQVVNSFSNLLEDFLSFIFFQPVRNNETPEIFG
jgi:hypothetical protein